MSSRGGDKDNSSHFVLISLLNAQVSIVRAEHHNDRYLSSGTEEDGKDVIKKKADGGREVKRWRSGMKVARRGRMYGQRKRGENGVRGGNNMVLTKRKEAQ